MKFRLLFCSLFLSDLSLPSGHAQQEGGEDRSRGDETASVALEEMVVSAPVEASSELKQAVFMLSGKELNQALEPTLGQTLARMPGVSSSYFGPAASRPILRGLDGDRVKVLQSGLNTLDASAASPDHALSFEPASLRSVEVVRGPATLLYGANANGGVVNATDGRIVEERLDGTIRGSMGGRFSSVDTGYQSNLMLEGGWGGLVMHLEAFSRSAQDVHIPGNARTVGEQVRAPLPPGVSEPSGVVPNSNLRTEGFSAGMSYVWDGGFIGFSWTEFHSNYASPADSAVFIDMNQHRLDVRGAWYKPLPRIKEISYKFAWSDYEHVEFENGMDNTAFKNDGYDARVEVKHEKIAGLEGVVGMQSGRSDFLVSGTEAFLPPTLTTTNALFFYEEAMWGAWGIQLGGRYDHVSVEAKDNPAFGPARERAFDNLSGSLGFVLKPSDDYSAALTITHAERAPSQQELYAKGSHTATGSYLVGDSSLGAETSLGFDLTLRKNTGWITGSVSGYHTCYQSFIGLFPTGVMIDTDGDLIGDTPEQRYRATQAHFLGAEMEATFHLLHPVSAESPQATTQLHWQIKADVVRARNASTGGSLPRIPPFHLTNALILERGGWTARLEGIYAAPQSRLAANEYRTESYFLVNLALSYRLVRGAVTTDIYVKGMNLTDADAREHTSFLKERMPLPGRGIVVGMKLAF